MDSKGEVLLTIVTSTAGIRILKQECKMGINSDSRMARCRSIIIDLWDIQRRR